MHSQLYVQLAGRNRVYKIIPAFNARGHWAVSSTNINQGSSLDFSGSMSIYPSWKSGPKIWSERLFCKWGSSLVADVTDVIERGKVCRHFY